MFLSAGLNLLRDDATALEDDAFSHRAYADVLTEVIHSSDGSRTVGLFGRWGVGKSSVLKCVEGQISSTVAFITFDAWRYDSAGFRRELLREISTQLADSFVDDYDASARLDELDFDHQKSSRHLDLNWGSVWPAAVAALVVFATVFAAIQINAVKQSLDAARGQPVLLSVIAGFVVFIAKAVSDVFYLAPESTTTKRLDDPDRFGTAFNDLLSHIKPDKVVIAVDNLDRCSAELVVELLTTVKAFLEPADVGKTVVFLIAVDDQALRSHLVKQGIDASNGSHAHVDEYLRKIFATTVRITPLLPGDLRDYTRGLVARLDGGLHLESDGIRSLVELLHATLRSNPRRIIHFLNDLQLRYRLLDARMSVKPSTATRLAVAKLALIEEEWPEAYATLQTRPHRLAEWDAAVRSAGEPPAELAEFRSEEWHRFAGFLRFSHDIEVTDVRGLIRLKRTAEQEDVPQYDDFVSAATGGRLEDVGRILSEHPDRLDAYAEALFELFEEERRADWRAAARSALLTAFTERRLHPAGDWLHRMLASAVTDPSMIEGMDRLPLDVLTATASSLPTGGQRTVVQVLIEALSGDSDSRAEEAARMLVSSGLPLDASQRMKVKESLGQPPLNEAIRWPAQALLLEADPLWRTPAVLNAVTNQLSQDALLWSNALLADPATRMLRILLGEFHDAEVADRVLATVPSTSFGESERADVLERIHNVVAAAGPLASDDGRRAAAPGLIAWLRTVSGRDRFDVAEWLLPLLPSGDEDTGIVTEYAASILQQGESGLAWLDAHTESLPPGARAPVADILVRSTLEETADVTQERLIATLDASGAGARLPQRLVTLLMSEQDISPRRVARGIKRLPNDLDEDAATTLLQAIVGRSARAAGAETINWLELLLTRRWPPSDLFINAATVLEEHAARAALGASDARNLLELALAFRARGLSEDLPQRIGAAIASRERSEWSTDRGRWKLADLAAENAEEVGPELCQNVALVMVNELASGPNRARASETLSRLVPQRGSGFLRQMLTIEATVVSPDNVAGRIALLRFVLHRTPNLKRLRDRLAELAASPSHADQKVREAFEVE